METIVMPGAAAATLPIGLGTTLYGDRVPEKDAHRQMGLFLELGGSVIDTARCYGAWAPGGFEGMVEQVVGRWLAQDGHRERVYLVTKGCHPLPSAMGKMRVTPEALMADLEQSLRNLKTDHIDLYLLHRDDAERPAEVILEALERAVAQGKLLRYGCSNWGRERIARAADLAKERGWQGFSADEVMWSLAEPNRDQIGDKTLVLMDDALLRAHRESGLPVMAYTSLAHGYLVRKHAGIPVKEQLEREYGNACNERLLRLMAETGADPMTLCLRYITRQSFPSMPLAAFSGEEQLRQAMRALQDRSWDEVLARAAAIREHQA